MGTCIDKEWLEKHPMVGKKATKKGGYAAIPGTGPKGETCKSCANLARKRMSGVYLKCRLMQAFWTGGAGTDVKARSPACKHWKKIE